MKRLQKLIILALLTTFAFQTQAQISFNSQDEFKSYYENLKEDKVQFTYLDDTVMVNVPPISLSNFNPNWELATSAQKKAYSLGYSKAVNREEDVGVDCHNDMVEYFKRETAIEKKKKVYKFLF